MTQDSKATTLSPFPGAEAHPDKRGGELCVEGTRVSVSSLLTRLSDGYTTSSAMEALGIIDAPVFSCLRGLADWLKAQNWTGAASSEPAEQANTATGLCETCGLGENACPWIPDGLAQQFYGRGGPPWPSCRYWAPRKEGK